MPSSLGKKSKKGRQHVHQLGRRAKRRLLDISGQNKLRRIKKQRRIEEKKRLKKEVRRNK